VKIIANLIDIDLKHEDRMRLFVNGNNGLVDLISPDDYLFFKKWREQGNLESAPVENETLYNTLRKREYIVEDSYDETEIRETVCKIIKAKDEENYRSRCRIHFLLTYGCNFACPYCYEQQHRTNARLSIEQIDKVFALYDDEIKDIGFFGGEPLLPGNMEIIKYIISKAPNATYSIITNGYYFKEYLELLSTVNVVNLQITLDGNRDQHNRTRILANGKGTYDEVMESIKLSLQHGFPTTVRMNVSANNIDGCLETKKYIEDQLWGNDNLMFEIQPIFQASHDEHNQLYSSLFNDDVETTNKNKILENLPPISNLLYNNVPLRPRVKACGAECYYRFYDPYGDIYSCIASVGDRRKRIGTYWPELSYEEHSFLNRDITTIPECKNCQYALVCGGGCANAVNADEDVTKIPNCYTMYNEVNTTIPYVYRLRKERLQ